jgi:hypothetical protein
MASNDPIASKSRKPALSVEEAERFASQIRPSWEMLGPDGAAGAFGQDDAPGVAAPAAGSVSKASDTIIEGVPTVAVGGSDEPAPDDGWGDDEPKAAKAIEEAEAPPIEAKPIASIGITSKAEVPASELPLPPQVGHPMVPTPGAPIAPSPPAKTKLGIGGTSGERAPMAKPKPTRSDASIPAPVSAKAAVAPAAGKTGASRSRAGATNPGVDYVPAETEAGDDIEIPISGAPKGLLLKIGGGVAAIAVILLAIKLFSGGSSKVEPVTTAPTATVATPPTPAPPEPPKATATTPVAAAPTAAPTTAPSAAPTAAPTAAATTAPTAKEKPVVAKVEPPPPVVKKPAPTSGGSTPPAGGGKKSGGIIRETPF